MQTRLHRKRTAKVLDVTRWTNLWLTWNMSC